MEQKISINGHPYRSYSHDSFSGEEMIQRSREWRLWMERRRTVRDFSEEPIPLEVIESAIMAASTAPSGAHKQPWTFCVVTDPALKKQIKAAAEKEEFESYHHRMSDEWLKDLAPLGTDWRKPFLENAPLLIVVFKRAFEYDAPGTKHPNYYVTESVGIACGFLLNALHHAGLVALTHTPSPMNFLSELLQRPDNERPFLLIPVGKVHPECYVPDILRKKEEEVIVWK
jgi:iodotyrosine deiodinase